ncbi:MAG: pilus assembly protein PilM [Patescibacteria group bacterium]|nr:pilus assembly protein PilM [Patescibacteria group bacterium]
MDKKGKVILGIDISDASIEACALAKTDDNFKVVAKAKAKFDIGVMERGILKKPKQFQIALQKLLKLGGFPSKEAVVSLPENAMYMISEDVPLDQKLDISRVVEEKLLGVIPESIDTMAVMHEMIPEADKGRLIIRATNKNNLLAIKKEVEMAGLKVVAVESEAEAKARSVVQELERDKAILILDIGALSTAISVFDSRGVSLSTTIPYAGKVITDSIAEKLHKPADEVEKLKHELGLSAKGEYLPVREGILEVLEKIVNELDDSIIYYQKSSNRNISEIRILGGSGRIKGLREYLETEIKGVKISFAKTWVDAGGEDIFSYFQTAIGLALKGFNYNNSLERGDLLKSLFPKGENLDKKENLLVRLKGIFHKDKNKKSEFFMGKAVNKPVTRIPVQLTGKGTNKPGSERFKSMDKAHSISSRSQNDSKLKLILIPSIILIIVSMSLVVYELFFRENGDSTVGQGKAGRESIPFEDLIQLDVAQLSLSESDFQTFTETITKSYAFKSTGKLETSEHVTGSVKIFNKTDTEYNLVATSRLITKDGELYRLDDAVSVPSGGSTVASVTADEPGADFSIDKGVKMTFPGLSNLDIDSDFYAESQSGFEASSSKFVTKDDLEKAEAEIANSLETIDFSGLVFDVEAGTILTEETFDSKVDKVEFSVKKGDKVASFEATATILISKIGIAETALIDQIDDRLQESLQAGERIEDYILRNCTIEVQSPNEAEGLVVLAKCTAAKK